MVAYQMDHIQPLNQQGWESPSQDALPEEQSGYEYVKEIKRMK